MILVTGGAGYIGSHFVKTYLERNPKNRVVIVDNLCEGHKKALPPPERALFFSENIGDVKTIRAICDAHPIEAVVHFAAFCYVGESQKDPPKYFQNNVINALNLLQALNDSGVNKFLFSSTCATYGNPRSVPIDEAHVQEPVNVYGLTKLIFEKSLGAYAANCGWSYVALRYFNASGADRDGLIGESHDPETHLIPLTLQAAMGQRERVEIYGDDYDTPDGTCIRDYVHVTDLAVAHCLALEKIMQGGIAEAINLGTGSGASVKEVIDLCRSVTGKDIPIKICKRRDGDPPRLVADYHKAAAVLGWKPEHDLKTIVQSAYNWEKNRRF